MVWGAALLWVIAHYRVAGNETASLPDRFFIVEQGVHSVRRDELLAFHVGAGVRHYPSGMVWVKIVVGLPGDSIEWRGDVVTVAGKVMGKAKAVNRFGETLARTPAGIIPVGHYFVATPHPDSYDSRYQDIGLIVTFRLPDGSYGKAGCAAWLVLAGNPCRVVATCPCG